MSQDWMHHEKDPLYQMGQEGQKANAQRAQQIAQGWANKERYYQGQVANAAGQIPLKLGVALLRFVPFVFCVYVAPFIGAAIAAACIGGAIAIARNGFFNLGLALGTIDVVLFVLGGAIALGISGLFFWACAKFTWAGKILAIFFVYSFLVWWIHHWQADAGWKFGSAWFFCLFLSSIIEGVAFFMERRRAGLPHAIF